MKITNKFIFAAVLVFPISHAQAVGAVSRACKFSTIPTTLQPLAAAFLTAVGAPIAYNNMAFRPVAEQEKYWINESLTTDYLEVRYYLYASSDRYTLEPNGNWQFRSVIATPSWEVRRISSAMKADSYFNIYFANRGPLYSARAGISSIYEQLPTYDTRAWAVIGGHAYHDPVNKMTWAMQDTVAIDCNLKDFGLANKGLFDW